MKILFVAVFDPASTNYSQANSFEELGHEVIRYEYRKREAIVDRVKRDQEIIDISRSQSVDLVLFSKCEGVCSSVITECNRRSITGMWYMDTMVSWSTGVITKIKNCSFTACAWKGPYEAAKALSDNVHWIDEGFDQNIDLPRKKRHIFDVSFIGNPDGKRKKWIEAVNGTAINNAYGPLHPKAVGNTVINLNFTREGGSSDRVYKVLAAGGFLLTEDYPGRVERFADGKDLAVFTDLEDLKRKVEYFLQENVLREGIAEQGYKTVQQYTRLEWARKIMEAYNEC